MWTSKRQREQGQLISMETRLWPRQTRFRCSEYEANIPFATAPNPALTCYSLVVKLSTYLHLVPRLSMRGAVRLCLHIVLIYEFSLFYLYLSNLQHKPVSHFVDWLLRNISGNLFLKIHEYCCCKWNNGNVVNTIIGLEWKYTLSRWIKGLFIS
jgi:hypothetical protein